MPGQAQDKHEEISQCKSVAFLPQGYLSRGPMNNGHVGRTLFVFDPDGNEAEFNTRYLYRPVWGEGGVEL